MASVTAITHSSTVTWKWAVIRWPMREGTWAWTRTHVHLSLKSVFFLTAPGTFYRQPQIRAGVRHIHLVLSLLLPPRVLWASTCQRAGGLHGWLLDLCGRRKRKGRNGSWPSARANWSHGNTGLPREWPPSCCCMCPGILAAPARWTSACPEAHRKGAKDKNNLL